MLGVLLVGCAGAVFPYKYYTLAAENFKGSLLGPEPKDDLDLAKECTPTQVDSGPCMVMKTDSFSKMKLEYKDMQQRLKVCESR